MKSNRFLLPSLAMAALLATGFSACDNDVNRDPFTITDKVVNDPQFSILTSAVTRAGLADALKTTPNLTVFAPNNDAFAKAGISADAISRMNVDTLRQILQYHVVPAEVRSGQVAQGSSAAPSLFSGRSIYLSNNTKGINLNGRARVTNPNIVAENGIIHGIDNVILPPYINIVQGAQGNSNLSLLVQAVIKCDLVGTLTGAGPFTVFAPTNKAFEDIGFNSAAIANASGTTLTTLRNVLLYHVVPARAFNTDFVGTSTLNTALANNRLTMIDGLQIRGTGNGGPANIIGANNLFTNGVVHVVDKVLLP